MVITTDIPLKGKPWNRVTDSFSLIFSTRTHYSIFILALSIGIMYDQRIEKLEEDIGEIKTVPRNVVQNNDNGRLDFFFQAAVLTTTTENFEEEHRLELAFADEVDFNKIAFLIPFANFGVTKLEELIGDTDIESMENIKNFLASTVEGSNFDIDGLPDDILLEED